MSSTVDLFSCPFYPQELHLHGNSIGDEGTRALMAGLSSHKGFSIEHSSDGAEKIADALKQNRSIATIDLGGNNIHAEGVNAIAQALKDNAIITTFHGNVKMLKLGWCQIAAKGAEHIADMLRYNNTISVLDLRANGLRDEGASCLARSLKVVNEALTSVDLGFIEIRDDGAFAIAQALKANEDVTVRDQFDTCGI
ncbi:hypothetical protein ARALYDRAFT_888610 [Arabidopsis lyrata subsp. lyrata]|uniref:Leucine-rich repeat family protein n=1 Tax=Arabidopsis lyrata subsp. lyrata TaxID=81972 RepID=D7KPB0_ARALL|nr:hypothetical protein ARALYDRAFT_888610 [Arabidopsis lyrata subsp. lyrata]